MAGRDTDLDDFRLLIDRLGSGAYERGLMFSGLRGVGKTVLLLEFDVIAREACWARRIGFPDVESGELGPGDEFNYVFDLGDDWRQHCHVLAEKVDPRAEWGGRS